MKKFLKHLAIATAATCTIGIPGGTASAAPGHAPSVDAAAATTLNWISWTAPASYPNSGGNYTYAREATGEIFMPDGSTVYVKFDGEVAMTASGETPSGFAVTGDTYWSGRPLSGNGQAYISSNVPELPSNGDRIGVVGSSVAAQSLSFYSDAGRTSPVNVSNIVMVIYSLGGARTNGKWDFDREFTILSDNRSPLSTYGPLAKSEPTTGTFRLSANEGTGTIQLHGTFSSVSWTVASPEFYATWNIGVTSENPPPPTITPTAETIVAPTGKAIDPVEFTPTAFNGATTYRVKSGTLPAGLTLDTTTGKITGTPSDPADAVQVEIEGTDGTLVATATITFTFVPPFSVTYDSQGGTSIPAGATSVNTALTNPGTPIRDGYIFAGWFTSPEGGTAITFPYTHGQTSSFTLYAQWTARATNAVPTTTATAAAVPTTTAAAPTPVAATVAPSARRAVKASTMPATGSSTHVPVGVACALLILGAGTMLRRRLAQ